jgi:WD40 repeat protein
MKRLRVYLSSTFEDLKDYRAAVFAALEKAGLDVARMEAYTAADERPLDLCLRDVAQSDIYVGLYAWRYGYEPPADHGNPHGKSITELEYRQAENCKLRKLAFLAHSDTKADWPDRFKDEVSGEGGQGEKLNAFRKELGVEKSASFFRKPDELATLVLAAIMRSGLSGRPYNIPPRPAGFVLRPNLTNALIASLGDPGKSAPFAHTIIQGAGGMGKTTLAIDACHVPEVVNAFPDGMLWTALGEKPDLARILSDLHVLATGSLPTMTGVDAIGQALSKALEGRRCLVFIDDVWQVEDLRHFLQFEGPRLLVTTRIRNLVEQAGWREIPVDEMEGSEGAALLGRGLSLDAATRQMLGAMADRLGCWPLLLDLVNARLLEEQKTGRGTPAECVGHVIQLFERRGVLGFDRRDSKARNTAVERSVEVGLEFAEEGFPGISEKAACISVFPEDTPIPVRVLADIWKMDELDVEEEVVRPLDNTSILRWDRQINEVRLHDMVQRALAARLDDPAAVHRKLLDTWRDPYCLPHDYAWRWFGWHCMRATEQDRLLGLLLDFDWLRAKLSATEINALVGEFDYVRHDPRVESLQRACRRSAHVLSRDKSQLAGQLLARLPEKEELMRGRILVRALATTEPWLRPMTASLVAERSIRWLRPAQAETLSNITFSSNGRWAAHVSDSFGETTRDVILWDLKEWRSMGPRFRTLPRLNPFALALSDNAHWCLYADSIGGVHRLGVTADDVWEGHAHRDLTIAKLLAISADGRRALSACQHGRLVAWDIDAGQHEVVWDENSNYIQALRLDATGDSAVVARADGSVHLIDLWPARQQTLFNLDGQASALARSPDNILVAAATTDGRIEVRSIESLEPPIGVFITQERPTSLALLQDNGYLAVGTDKGTVEVWSIERNERSARYSRAHTYEIERVTFSYDAARVVSADSLHIKEWELEASEDQEQEPAGSRAAGPVKVTADGKRAIATLENGRLGVWNLRTGAMESSLPPAKGHAFGSPGVGSGNGIMLAVDTPRILSWNENLLCVWDLEAGAGVASLSVIDTKDAAITPDGTGVVFISGKDIKLWRPDTGELSVLGSYKGDPPRYVAISPDGQRALTSGGHRGVRLWRLNELSSSELERVRDLRAIGLDISEAELAFYSIPSRDKPSIIAFAGPGEAIITTGDGLLFLLDIREAQSELIRLDGRYHSDVNRLLVNCESKLFVTSSYDQAVKVWDLGARRNIATLDANPGYVDQFSISAERVLLHTRDGALKIVSLRDGTLLAAFQGDKQIITCAADSELQWVVARDQGGQMHFFHVEG